MLNYLREMLNLILRTVNDMREIVNAVFRWGNAIRHLPSAICAAAHRHQRSSRQRSAQCLALRLRGGVFCPKNAWNQ